MTEGIKRWIDRLSEPRREFGDIPPCPYAKGCRWAVYRTNSFWYGIQEGFRMFSSECFDVLIYACKIDTLSSDDASSIAHDYGDIGITVLVSDPRRPTIVFGYQTTQDQELLFIFQWTNDLYKARSILDALGYYRGLPQQGQQ